MPCPKCLTVIAPIKPGEAETLDSIQKAIAFRFDTQPGVQYPSVPGAPTRNTSGELKRLLRALPIILDMLLAVWMFGLLNVVRATKQIVVSLDRIAMIRCFNLVTHNSMPTLQSHYSSVAPDNCRAPRPQAVGDAARRMSSAGPPTFREDVVAPGRITLTSLLRWFCQGSTQFGSRRLDQNY